MTLCTPERALNIPDVKDIQTDTDPDCRHAQDVWMLQCVSRCVALHARSGSGPMLVCILSMRVRGHLNETLWGQLGQNSAPPEPRNEFRRINEL